MNECMKRRSYLRKLARKKEIGLCWVSRQGGPTTLLTRTSEPVPRIIDYDVHSAKFLERSGKRVVDGFLVRDIEGEGEVIEVVSVREWEACRFARGGDGDVVLV